jgi:hypothetical protein
MVVCPCHFEDEVSPGKFQEIGDEIGQEDLSEGVQGNTLLIVVADAMLTDPTRFESSGASSCTYRHFSQKLRLFEKK